MVRPWDIAKREAFSAVVSQMIAEGEYPIHSELIKRMGRADGTMRSGLSTSQSRWRREVLEQAGFDARESAKQRRLVPRSTG